MNFPNKKKGVLIGGLAAIISSTSNADIGGYYFSTKMSEGNCRDIAYFEKIENNGPNEEYALFVNNYKQIGNDNRCESFDNEKVRTFKEEIIDYEFRDSNEDGSLEIYVLEKGDNGKNRLTIIEEDSSFSYKVVQEVVGMPSKPLRSR